MNYIYQLVTFIDVYPELPVNTPIYSGPMGWIPNVAIKCRFGIENMDEAELLSKINKFCEGHFPFGITFTQVAKPERMPESVIEVSPVKSLMTFHNDFIKYFGDSIESKYPEREGVNYYPHMTITWQGRQVIDPAGYLPKPPQKETRHINRVCLVKDVDGENSQVLAYFDIKGNAFQASQ